MSSLVRSALAGAGLAAISAGAALAYPATVTTDLNLRSGPGTGYGVVATMPAGSRVDVQACLGNGWCQLGFAGTSGYASGNYLAGGRAGPAPAPVVVDTGPDYIAPEYYEYAYLYPPYWNNGYFYYWYGGRWRHIRRDRRWWDHHRGQFDRARHMRPRPGAGRPGAVRPGRPEIQPHPGPGVRPGRPGIHPWPDHGARPGRPAIQPHPGPGARPGPRPDRGAVRMNNGGGRAGPAMNAAPRGGGAPAGRAPAGRGGGNDRRDNQ
ncbi:MAG TPA: SH3 domain-containing protein [Hyphomicrobiales bacterium]|nr:SH3 domain-containing protein [Hyphomicrobiales bacterium]